MQVDRHTVATSTTIEASHVLISSALKVLKYDRYSREETHTTSDKTQNINHLLYVGQKNYNEADRHLSSSPPVNSGIKEQVRGKLRVV